MLLLLIVAFVALFVKGYILGDGDCVFLCDVVGLLLTVVLFPPLLLVGAPLCWAWPVRDGEHRSGVFVPRLKNVMFWWRGVFKVWNG
jgi:hypothetical protein